MNGFNLNDGNLKTVPGSHLIKDDLANGRNDEHLAETCKKAATIPMLHAILSVSFSPESSEVSYAGMAGKTHPVTGKSLAIRLLSCPRGSVVAMWTQ